MKKEVKISVVKNNPNNPRLIKDDKFKKLVKSIKSFPEMLEKRPIVVDEDMMVLGGNMRLKASAEAGLKTVWIDVAEGWSKEQKAEFVIKDNASFGEWDWDILANEWDNEKLNDWGLDVWKQEQDYEPNLAPMTTYDDVTKEEIEREAQKLAVKMIQEQKGTEVICPECGEEFEIQ
jgi:ParB-like chromosome segregation protein Spo0J|tara:strand:+ start:901 stop:1428 length:528 start_codon:yes stop_codon:yes gene_type:complete